MKFTWLRKGESGWTDAEVELLLSQQNDFIFKNEVVVLKDKLSKLDKETKTTLSEKEKELADTNAEVEKLKKENTTLTETLAPIKEEKIQNERIELVTKTKKLVNPKLAKDALLLAKIDADDDEAAIVEKVTGILEGRDYLKFVEQTPEEKAAAEKIIKAQKDEEARKAAALNMTKAQLAAIANNKQTPPPTDDGMELDTDTIIRNGIAA